MKPYNILFLTCLSIFFCSCEDHRLDGMEPDKVYLGKRGLYQVDAYATGETAHESVWTNKSGIGDQYAKITYTVDESILTQYNEQNGTNFLLLPEDCYVIPQKILDIAAEDRTAFFFFEYYPEKILDHEGGIYGSKMYVLPLRIVSEGAPLSDKVESGDRVLLNFNILQPCIQISPTVSENNFTVGDTQPLEIKLKIAVEFDNPWDIPLTYETDTEILQKLVDSYNTENNNSCQLLPADAYTLSVAEPVILQGAKELEVICRIDKSKVPFGKNLLPFTIKQPEAPLTLSEKNAVSYITVKSDAPQLDRTNWVIQVSSEDTTENGVKENLTDGTPDTFWHVVFKGVDKDRRIYIDFGEEKLIYQVELFARTSGGNSHTGFHIYTSQTGKTIINAPGATGETDDDEWTECGYLAVKNSEVNLRNDRSWTIECSPAPQRTRYLKIKFDYDGNQTCVGELYVRGLDIEE